MANLKNSKKKIKIIKKKGISNNEYLASMKTAIKKLKALIASGDKKAATESLDLTISRIDKAVKKGVIHINKATRHKSKLSKSVNEMK